MRNSILLAGFLLFFKVTVFAQEDSIALKSTIETIHTATYKTKAISIDLSNSEDIELALKNIHKFRYLESLTLEGEADQNKLKKLVYRLSILKNLTSLTLRENDLAKIPENIANLRTLLSVTVEGNSNLDYADLFTKLKNIPLDELHLIDNDLKKMPITISEMVSLKKIQLMGSNQLDYNDFLDQLAKLPVLSTLSIPVNYISELPKNIYKLRSLQVLDVSNNNLTELPQEISSLKTINNLSIQGNLLLNPAQDLEKLKGNSIQYLSLDKEISGEEIEQIKKMFPEAQIDFPINKEDEEINDLKKADEEKSTSGAAVYKGELKAKKELRILSDAYALYPPLFRNLIYGFDTLNFEERYKDLRYENTSQIVNNTVPRRRIFYFRKSSVNYEKPGKKKETWFRFATNDRLVAVSYPELRVFMDMYWVYKGDLTKKEFEKKYLYSRKRPLRITFFNGKRNDRINAKEWNDIRIDLDKNNNLFSIEVKNDSGFSKFTAYPVLSGFPIERSQKSYTRRFELYRKALFRRGQTFKRSQLRAKYRYNAVFKMLNEYNWNELRLRMSDEEKLMSKEEWLEYYDHVVASEPILIDNISLSPAFILRALSLKGYLGPITNSINPAPFQNTIVSNRYGLKTVSIDFVDSKSAGKLVVANIFILNNKNKTISQINGTLGLLPNTINLKQFSSNTLLVELRNGNWGAITSDEIDKQNFEPNKTYQLNTVVFDKNLDLIGDLLKIGAK